MPWYTDIVFGDNALKPVSDNNNLRLKVLRILHFISHRRPTLWIWQHGDPPPPPPSWSMMFNREQKCSGHPSTFFFCGGSGSILSERGLEGSILKLDIQRAFFLTFLSKIEGWRSDESTRFTPMWPGFEYLSLRHSSFGFMVSPERIFPNVVDALPLNLCLFVCLFNPYFLPSVPPSLMKEGY